MRAEDGLPVSRETFMMILVDITAIHIRANYFSPTTEVRSVSQTQLQRALGQNRNLELQRTKINLVQSGYRVVPIFAMLELTENIQIEW